MGMNSPRRRNSPMKNRSQKRTLTFERLETKATPAALLIAMAPLDDASHDQIEPVAQDSNQSLIDSSTNWQFSHSVGTLLQFVDENTNASQEHAASPNALPRSHDSQVCAPPTWDQCRGADEMMKLHDRELQALVMAEVLGSEKLGPKH